MSLTVKVLLGMALGIIVGLILNLTGLISNSFVDTYIVNGLFHVVGKMFVNALKMLVVPLVFFSLICGVCGIGDIRMLGRVGGKSFVLYMMTTAIAIATAILIAVTFGIGKGMNQATDAAFAGKESPPLTQVLIDIILRILSILWQMVTCYQLSSSLFYWASACCSWVKKQRVL